MFDATSLLGALLEGRSNASTPGRVGAAVQQQGQGGMLEQVLTQLGSSTAGGGLGALLGTVMGSATGGSASGGSATGSGTGAAGASGGGMLAEIAAMARRAAASPGAEVKQNNPAAIGGIGALAGALLGGGKGAVGGGLMAVLGSLAYSALQNSGLDASAAQPATPQPGTTGTAQPGGTAVPPTGAPTTSQPGSSATTQPAGANATSSATPQPGSASPGGQTPTLSDVPGYADPAEIQRKARLTFRAMIQATKADGEIDDAEAARLHKAAESAGDTQEVRDFVKAELDRPMDVASLAKEAKSRQDAVEIYAASLMAIDVDTQAEKDYLASLARALDLPQSTIDQVNTSLNLKP
jgi:uncharacterized membrane protein YebE (DUF533 family)